MEQKRASVERMGKGRNEGKEDRVTDVRYNKKDRV